MEAQSKYLQNAKFRIENKKWLSYSSNIALRVLAALILLVHAPQIVALLRLIKAILRL
jgi:hypothetical protein